MRVRELTAEASFTRIEEDVRRFWRRHGVPQAISTVRRDGPACTVYQQPLGAAGQPWIDQVRLLATADLLARHRTMQGDAVQRRAGWSCHGLPVEVAVERALGPDLAAMDLAQFNAACREAAVEGMRQGEALAEWLGVWGDPAGSYASLTPQAIGTVWAALRRLWDAGRLRRERAVVPVCPRCATPLAEAETTRIAVEVEALSAWLRLPWHDEPDTYFLTWARFPWMLVGMVALAVQPEATYALIERPGDEDHPPRRLVLAEAALDRVLVGPYRLVRRMAGKSLRGARYHPPFTFVPLPEGTGRVVLGDGVSLERGSGVLPVTPAFDSASFALAQVHGLPIPDLVDDGGKLNDAVTPWRGLAPLEAEPYLVEDLRARGILFRQESRLQSLALCPYCETSLQPQARDVWLVETASGRWTVSRDRAWGAPLPIWTCEGCGGQTCVAGLDDLAHRTGLELDQVDPHRPVVDGLTFPCATCGGTMRRVAAVVDAAFETALLPWATAVPEAASEGGKAAALPARVPRPDEGPTRRSLAVGLGDKDIGWLGDATEIVALLYGTLAWQQAVALEEERAPVAGGGGRTTPADALRWAAYTHTTPEQAERDVLRPLWQMVVHRLENGALEAESSAEEFFDRWLAARLQQATAAATGALDASDPGRAAAELARLVADLSGWYVSHRLGIGAEVLDLLGKLLAPFLPHLVEAIHREVGGRPVDSVHLADWPVPDPAWADRGVLADMALVRRLAALGQAARARAGIEAEQVVRRAFVTSPSAGLPALVALRGPLALALHTERVEIEPDAGTRIAWRLAQSPQHGPDRGVAPAEIDAALAALNATEAATLAGKLRNGLSVGLEVSGQAIVLLPDEVTLSVQARPGWAAAFEGGTLVLLELD
jgi:isoleucyl-tRNA synthetase